MRWLERSQTLARAVGFPLKTVAVERVSSGEVGGLIQLWTGQLMRRLAKGQWWGRDGGDQDQGQAPSWKPLHGAALYQDSECSGLEAGLGSCFWFNLGVEKKGAGAGGGINPSILDFLPSSMGKQAHRESRLTWKEQPMLEDGHDGPGRKCRKRRMG